MHLRVILAGLIMVGACTQPVFAQQHPNLDAKAIIAQQAAIRADAVARVGRYKDISDRQRSELFSHQDRVTQRLADQAMTTDLPEYDQIIVFNALEAIASIVNQTDDERMICQRKRPVGSNRTQTVCRTVAQRNAEQESGADLLQRRDQR